MPLSRVHGTVARVRLVSRERSGARKVPLMLSPPNASRIPHATATVDARSSVWVRRRSRVTHLVVVLLLLRLWRLWHNTAIRRHSRVHLITHHPHVLLMRLLRIDIHLLLWLHSKLASWVSLSSLDGGRHF